MAKIFTTPKEIKAPEFDFRNIVKSKQDEENYIKTVQEFCKKNTKNTDNEFVGELIKIPHADSYAMYVVHTMKPLELIHLNIGDGWDSPYADLLTAKKVKEMISNDRTLTKIFGKRS